MLLTKSNLTRSNPHGFFEGSNLPQVSVRDSRQTGTQWKNTKVLDFNLRALASAVANIINQDNKVRRRILPAIESVEYFHPFKIYQPSNVASFIGQMTTMFTTTAGPGIQCMIVGPTTPTNLAASPPVVSTADSWRFFAVRSGTVEYRYIYSFVLGATGFNSVPLDPNNWGVKYAGSDLGYGITNTDGNGTFEYGNSFDTDTDATINPPLVIGIMPDGTDPISCSLWIQITADTASDDVSMAVNGMANNLTGETVTYPNGGPLLIPVGELQIPLNLTQVPYQFLFDNVNNRFPGGNGNFGGNSQGTILNIRGTFSGYAQPDGPPNIFSPADLNTQLFFPGDIIIVNDVGATDSAQTIGTLTYLFIGPQPAFSVNAADWVGWSVWQGPTPFDSDPNWLQISSVTQYYQP
jgi:hypothetical protein